MNITEDKNVLRWVIIGFSVVTVSIILWNTYVFFQGVKEMERKNIAEYATAVKDLQNAPKNAYIGDLGFTVAQNMTSIPLIRVTYKGEISTRNLPANIEETDTVRIKQLIEIYKSQNEPYIINYEGKPISTIYYGNSDVINKIKYYPLALVVVMVLFSFVIWFFYRSTKASEQNKLWAGMAKESAHQIGTPLSSLVGWTHILRDSKVEPSYIDEMEKDINRLKTITDRFSKIGSVPKLVKADVVEETRQATDYLKNRVSKLVEITMDLPEQPIPVLLNKELYDWVIENLIKNGIDAMKGKGALHVFVKAEVRQVSIQISDTGKGIPKNDWKRIFTPGFTTKKRGWGLGLSLAKRIIHDYHKGKIKVMDSKKNVGTTFEITIDRI